MFNMWDKIKYIFLLLICGAFVGCSHISKTHYKKFMNSNVITKKLELQNKKIFFIGISHIGTRDYYNNIKKIVDSLKQEKYIFVVEGLDAYEKRDSTYKINRMKFNKLLGETLSENGEYLDTINHKFLNRYSYPPELNLMNQPTEKNIFGNKFLIVDTSIRYIVEKFEQEYFKIELNECDLALDLNQKNDCKKIPKKYRKIFWNDFVIRERNLFIAKELEEINYPLICAVYGSAHVDGIIEYLK